MVMYSGFPKLFTTEDTESEKNQRRKVYSRSQITAEIKTAMGLYYFPNHPLNNDTAEFSFNDYVTIISGKKVGRMFNADSVYIYDIPGADSVYFLNESLENIRKSSYPFCTGMFISKTGRVSMDFKLFFTEKGKKKEKQYIEKLSRQVWINDI